MMLGKKLRRDERKVRCCILKTEVSFAKTHEFHGILLVRHLVIATHRG